MKREDIVMRECNAGSAGGTILVEQLSISEGSTPP